MGLFSDDDAFKHNEQAIQSLGARLGGRVRVIDVGAEGLSASRGLSTNYHGALLLEAEWGGLRMAVVTNIKTYSGADHDLVLETVIAMFTPTSSVRSVLEPVRCQDELRPHMDGYAGYLLAHTDRWRLHGKDTTELPAAFEMGEVECRDGVLYATRRSSWSNDKIDAEKIGGALSALADLARLPWQPPDPRAVAAAAQTLQKHANVAKMLPLYIGCGFAIFVIGMLVFVWISSQR